MIFLAFSLSACSQHSGNQEIDQKGDAVSQTRFTVSVPSEYQSAARDQVYLQMDEMLKRKDVFTPDHVVFYQKVGGRHNFVAVQEYLHNAISLLFNQHY